MKTKAFLMLVAFLALSIGVEAKGWEKNRGRRAVKAERRYNPNTRVFNSPGYRTVTVLPYGYSQINYNNSIYYYSQGNYYRPLPNRHYEIILPHAGMVIPELPVYQRVRVNGRIYYTYQNYLYSAVRTPYGTGYRVEMRY